MKARIETIDTVREYLAVSFVAILHIALVAMAAFHRERSCQCVMVEIVCDFTLRSRFKYYQWLGNKDTANVNFMRYSQTEHPPETKRTDYVTGLASRFATLRSRLATRDCVRTREKRGKRPYRHWQLFEVNQLLRAFECGAGNWQPYLPSS